MCMTTVNTTISNYPQCGQIRSKISQKRVDLFVLAVSKNALRCKNNIYEIYFCTDATNNMSLISSH